MSNTIVVIDANNQAHKAYHSYKNLTYKGKSVSVLYGFLSMLRASLNFHKPSEVFVTWDHCRHKERNKLLPSYKGNRSKEPNANFDYEDFQRQLVLLRKILFRLGIAQVHGDNMEADDYIYWIVRKKAKKNKVVIISSDKDFNQLLVNPNVRIWDSHKRILLHKKNLNKYYPYTPEETVDYLSLLGDSSDNIPGYSGMGPVNIRKFLDEFGSISSFLENKDAKFSRIDRKKLLEVYKTNRMLIDLPAFYNAHIKGKHSIVFYENTRRPTYKPNIFKNFCIKFNFTSFLRGDFTKPFKDYADTINS